MSKSKREREVVNNNDTRSELPSDLVFMIVGRLPPKSVARLLAVSKTWGTLLRSKEFNKAFSAGLLSQPSTLYVCTDLPNEDEFQEWNMFSSSPSPSLIPCLASSSFLSRVRCPFPYKPRHQNYSLDSANGLVSLGYGTIQLVANPMTGSCKLLPSIRTGKRNTVVKSFFGYDSTSDQHKLLCLSEEDGVDHPAYQHQLFTVGEKRWKRIHCGIKHRPVTKSVCIKDALFYVAKTGERMAHWSLIRFDLTNESFDILSRLPTEMSIVDGNILMNYKGQVAIPIKPTEYTNDVWCFDLDSDTQEWLKRTFTVNRARRRFIFDGSVIGITHNDEFILASTIDFHDFHIYHYNPDTDTYNKVNVSLHTSEYQVRPWSKVTVFSNYVGSGRML